MNFNAPNNNFYLEEGFYTTPQPNPLLEMLRVAAVNATMAQFIQPTTIPQTPRSPQTQSPAQIPISTVQNQVVSRNAMAKNGKSKKSNKARQNPQDRMPLQTRNAVTIKPPTTTPIPTVDDRAIIPATNKPVLTEDKSKEVGPAKGVDDDTVYFVQEDGKTVGKTAHGTVPLTHSIKVRKVNTNESVVIKDAAGNVLFTVEKKGVMSFE